MTRIEDRLADALAARAKAVDPKSIRPLPWAAPIRHRRERRRRWLAPAAAAISIAVVAAAVTGAVALIPRHAHRAGHRTYPITPQTVNFLGKLWAVDAFSATNAWAVGQIVQGPNGQGFAKSDPLIMHWDGRSWRRVPVPSVGGGGWLRGIAGSPDDLWAVGNWNGTRQHPGAGPLIAHWNGRRWQARRYSFHGEVGNLLAVSASSATDVWAVGQASQAKGAMIMHWNGRSWKQVTVPHPVPGQYLIAVTAISANDAWADGATGKVGDARAAIMHWNGTSWRIVPNPDSGLKNSSLADLTALSANEIWTVGYADGVRVLRWYNAAWHVAPASRLPSLADPLWSIAAVTPDDIWTAGNNASFTDVVMRHWDGIDWSTPKGFKHHIPGVIYRLSARSASDVWAVGYYGKPRVRPLILHWNGKSWAKVLS